MKKIVFFGDSICFGQGVSIHKGWVPRFSEYLEKTSKFEVRNNSVNGDTSRKALERIYYDVLSKGVDVTIIQFGLNDCNYWKTDKGLPRVLPNAFKENMVEIITRLINHNCSIVFLLTNHPTKKNLKYNLNNNKYNSIIRSLKKIDDKVKIIDIEKIFKKEKNYLQKDGIHLNLKGHDLYYKNFIKNYEKLISLSNL